jgi:hypothetical protein
LKRNIHHQYRPTADFRAFNGILSETIGVSGILHLLQDIRDPDTNLLNAQQSFGPSSAPQVLLAPAYDITPVQEHANELYSEISFFGD